MTPPRSRHRFPARRLWQAVSLALFCYLLFYVAWPYSDSYSATFFADKEHFPAETFLYLDPLTSLSTAIAGRFLGVSLLWLIGVLAASVVWPRWFCAYVCPLGTTIDLFDWAIGSRVKRRHLRPRGRWVNAKYWLLVATLVAALLGVLLSGYVAAIPVATRGFVLVLGPAQLAFLKHSGMVRPVSWDYWLSVALFVSVIGLGLLGPRFWCRYVCPSGATFSLFSLARLRERRATSECTRCGKCVAACPFDAIRADGFTTRIGDCALCGTCRAACPVAAIEYVPRWRALHDEAEPAEGPSPFVTRREFLIAAGAGAVAALGIRWSSGAASGSRTRLLRPPGSMEEEKFLDLCIRCGECFKVCPGPVLHPAGFEAGLEALWTPVAVPSWAGCHQDCNACGQVCPTGAIRPLPLEEKRKTPMGLAVVNTRTCLPHSGEQDCQLCFEECQAAGYDAIEMRTISLEVGDVPEGVLSAAELEEAGRIRAPFVKPEACVGCGLCEYRCHTVWKKQRRKLGRSAITIVPTGSGKISA